MKERRQRETDRQTNRQTERGREGVCRIEEWKWRLVLGGGTRGLTGVIDCPRLRQFRTASCPRQTCYKNLEEAHLHTCRPRACEDVAEGTASNRLTPLPDQRDSTYREGWTILYSVLLLFLHVLQGYIYHFYVKSKGFDFYLTFTLLTTLRKIWTCLGIRSVQMITMSFARVSLKEIKRNILHRPEIYRVLILFLLYIKKVWDRDKKQKILYQTVQFFSITDH